MDFSQSEIEQVGLALNKIAKNIETHSIEAVSAQLDDLILHWKPLVEKHYSYRVSSLVEAIIAKSVYE